MAAKMKKQNKPLDPELSQHLFLFYDHIELPLYSEIDFAIIFRKEISTIKEKNPTPFSVIFATD